MSNPAETNVTLSAKQSAFAAALYALLADYDLTELMRDEDAASPIRLHAKYTEPNFNPESHAKSPQYASLAITDSNPQSVIIAGEEFLPNRMQLSINFFHLVPADYVEPTKAAAVATETKAATRISLTADAIKNALSRRTDVVAANPSKVA